MVEIDVTAVNIHVQGVGLSSDKEKDPTDEKGAGQEQTIVEVQEDPADDEK